ncbi:heparinase II/III family protein [Sphingomonas oryzagri]|uniref:Heparinase II/III family protein n=1 Tax=Sphingomonas oryzagri TaxID=3042314 RepID=A0ABT6MWL6_9SPHN|nr:heparinase II/III family protein [Sphingomonas oryzagri]MDH7637272.1 heparinase II/III family protein [Sphingomonas oryzagri]
MPSLRKLRLYASAARHIPIRSVLMRGVREVRTRRLRAGFYRIAQVADAALCARIADRIARPDFVASARRLAELTASTYRFDPAGPSLHFLGSGDVVDLAGVRDVPWRVPGAIPASDVNRAFFIAFVEHATLAVQHDPAAGLDHIADMIAQLDASGRPTASYLSIPWQPLPAARRLANLLCAASLALAADPALADSPALRTIVGHVLACEQVVDRLREDDLGFNHLATDIFGQCLAAAARDDAPLLARRAREFVAAMDAQVGADGFQLERSATYQAHLLGHFDVLLAGGLLTGGAAGQGAALAEHMRGALAVLTHPDGGFAVFNDCADGDGPSPASLGVDPRPPEQGIRMLAEAGFARLDAGGSAVLFDVGKGGPDEAPGHAHADFLSIELSVDGHRFIVDPGVASYKPGPERDWTRSAHSHNGPAFDGLEPMEMFGAWRVGRRGRAFTIASPFDGALTAAATQTGYDRAGARSGRTVALSPDGALAIVDAWAGRGGGGSRFLIDGDWAIAAEAGNSLTFRHGDGAELVVGIFGGTVAHRAASHFRFGPRRALSAIEIRVEPSGDARHCALTVRRPSADPIWDAASLAAAGEALLHTIPSARPDRNDHVR